jgi:hypothetical protein
MRERVRNTLEYIDMGNNFLNRILVAQKLREKIDKWDYMKLNSFSTAKEEVTRMKKLPTQ